MPEVNIKDKTKGYNFGSTNLSINMSRAIHSLELNSTQNLHSHKGEGFVSILAFSPQAYQVIKVMPIIIVAGGN